MALFKIAHEKYTSLNGNNKKWLNADFNTAQNLVTAAEGGYSSTPLDPGNWTGGKIGSGTLIGTNYGISAPVLCDYLGYIASADEMKNLPFTTAIAIYKKNYWTPIGGDQITDQKVANVVYDGAVNEGVGGIKKIVVDSLAIPTYSVTAINAANPTGAFNAIAAGRAAHYTSIGGYALPSWMARLAKLGYSGLQSTVSAAQRHIGLTITMLVVMAGLIGGGIYLIRKK